ncbi:MAG: hypothetical protein LVQ96_03180 [Thermoplasmatales archaeon]|nr:hypothetical protein [Thermoplasmatales archaeon]MCW6170152.1 hypothetical protein [Thermoplasmatales archaeon]
MINKGKVKNVRGRSYNYNKIENLLDEGLSTGEIAARLHTDSLQSVRHAIEKIKRERRILKEAERKRKLEIQREEKRKEDVKRRYASINQVGLLRMSVDHESLAALEAIVPKTKAFSKGELSLIHHSGSIEIFIPNNASASDIRNELYELGFFALACNKTHETHVLNVSVIPNNTEEEINWRRWIDGIITLYVPQDVQADVEDVRKHNFNFGS